MKIDWLRTLFLCVVLTSPLRVTPAAQAQGYALLPAVGSALQRAGLAALAASVSDEKGTTLTLQEILKGDISQKGQTRFFPSGVKRRYNQPEVPAHSAHFAILAPANWDGSAGGILAVYSKPEEVQALRALVAIYGLPTERLQLIALRDAALAASASKATPILRQQLWFDFAGMRNPADLPLLLELSQSGDEDQRCHAIRVLDRIGDKRAIPALLASLKSPHAPIIFAAAAALNPQFAGDRGVTKAFREGLSSPQSPSSLKLESARYIARYDHGVAAKFYGSRLSLAEAIQAFDAGDIDKTHRELMSALGDPECAKLTIFTHRPLLESVMSAYPDDVNTIQKLLMPSLAAIIDARGDPDVEDGDEFGCLTAEAVRVLALFRNPAADALLQKVLADAGASERPLTAAAWALGDRDDSKAAAAAILRKRADWAAIEPVFEVARAVDPSTVLIEMVNSLGARQIDDESAATTRRWAIVRLGILKERRAVPALFKVLQEPRGPSDFAADALLLIGGAEVEQGFEPFLDNRDAQLFRKALESLSQLQGKRFLPKLRQMLGDADPVKDNAAARFIGELGEGEDLVWLRERTDFWTTPPNRYAAYRIALLDMLRRLKYDLNGPIPNAPPVPQDF